MPKLIERTTWQAAVGEQLRDEGLGESADDACALHDGGGGAREELHRLRDAMAEPSAAAQARMWAPAASTLSLVFRDTVHPFSEIGCIMPPRCHPSRLADDERRDGWSYRESLLVSRFPV